MGEFVSGCILSLRAPCAVQRSGQERPWNVINIATIPSSSLTVAAAGADRMRSREETPIGEK